MPLEKSSGGNLYIVKIANVNILSYIHKRRSEMTHAIPLHPLYAD